MARKKKEKEKRPADYWTNPYYREEEEKARKLDPARSRFFTYLLLPVGVLLGLLLGIFMENVMLSMIFGGVVGIMVGTKLDLKFPRKKKDDNSVGPEE